MIRDRILDDTEKLELVDGRTNLEFEEEASHHCFEEAHATGDVEAGIDHDEDAVHGADEDLEAPTSIEGRVEEVEEALVDDIGTPLCGICLVFGVVDAVLFTEEGEGTVSRLDGLDGAVFENDDCSAPLKTFSW